MSEQKTIDFRYAKPALVYSLILGCLFSCIFGFILFVKSTGSLELNFIATFLGGMIVITGINIWFTLLAYKLTERKGEAVFNKKDIDLKLGTQSICILYSDIRRIEYVTIVPQSPNAMNLYKIRIETATNFFLIHCSFHEARDYHKRKAEKPSIWFLCQKLASRAGHKVEYTGTCISMFPHKKREIEQIFKKKMQEK